MQENTIFLHNGINFLTPITTLCINLLQTSISSQQIHLYYFYRIENTNTYLLTDLEAINQSAFEKEAENGAFTSFLKSAEGEIIDATVHLLNSTIAPQIDCTACGNCCKTLMINVTDEESDKLAAHLQQPRVNFDATYLEKGSSMMVINAIPCHFLNENKCTVYDYRFAGCREFPALHLPHFTKRLFTTFMHYNRCPIIYNVVEQLKVETGFFIK